MDTKTNILRGSKRGTHMLLPLFLSVLFVACSLTNSTEEVTGEANQVSSRATLSVGSIATMDAYSRGLAGNIGMKDHPNSSPITNTIYRSAAVAEHVWRSKKYTNIYIVNYLFENRAPRTFNYTNVNGENFWLNLLTYYETNLVWYEVVSDKRGTLQTGLTTIDVTERYAFRSEGVQEPYLIYTSFDVDFHPSTYLNNQKLLVMKDPSIWTTDGSIRGTLTNRIFNNAQ
ncbi:MAG: hypothetical protein ACRCY4_03165, partial [Brevinema sp.]